MRDKAFAHTDIEEEILSLLKVAYYDIRKLIEKAEEYISFIYRSFLDRAAQIETTQHEFEQNIHLILKGMYFNES